MARPEGFERVFTPNGGHADSGFPERKREHSSVPKQFTEEFKRQAVDLYETTEGATLQTIAEDLGISKSTLSTWLHTYRSSTHASGPGRPTDVHTECVNCAEVKALRAEKVKLETERDILRQAAKYFAGEMNW